LLRASRSLGCTIKRALTRLADAVHRLRETLGSLSDLRVVDRDLYL
jgi:hypothetical protein